MPHALLHRGRSFRALTGNQFCVRRFSSVILECCTWTKQDWEEVCTGVFEPLVARKEKYSNTQLAESVALLPIKVNNTAEYESKRQKALTGNLTENYHQSSECEDLLPFFRILVRELNVDQAILLCAKLPADRLQPGIDTLIRVCLEGVYDARYKGELADKIFDLLEQCKGKRCTPSEVTRRSLVKWLSDSGDSLRARRFLQLLQNSQYAISPGAEHSEDSTSPDTEKKSRTVTKKSVPAKSCNIIAKDLSRFPNELGKSEVTADTQSRYQEHLSDNVKLHGLEVKSCNIIAKELSRFPNEFGESQGTADTQSRYQEHLSDNVKLDGLEEVSNADVLKLIGFYARGCSEDTCGSPRHIKKVSQASQKVDDTVNIVTNAYFNRIIAYCAHLGEIGRCIELIQTMKSTGLQPCAASYEPLIVFFAGTLEISKAEDILQMMRNCSLHATKKSYECLITAYAKSDNLEKAFNLIEEIPLEELEPDLYNPLIYAYGMMGRVSYALNVFKQMESKNVKPNTQNFASLIHTCSYRKDLQGAEQVFRLFKKQCYSEESEKLVVSAMMRVYAACGSDEQIKKVISCTYAKNLVGPEAKAALLKGFAEGGKLQKAMQIYNQFRKKGNWPDSGTFISFLTNLGKAGEVDQLLDLFDPFKKSIQTMNRVVQEDLSSIVCCKIVHALLQHNELEKALGFLQKVQLNNAGDVETLCLKVFTLDKCNDTSLQHVPMSLKDKFEFLCAMRNRLKVQPSRLAYESLLESCAREKNFNCADRVLQMMKNDNLVLNVFTYLILLRVAAASKDLEVLTLFLRKMRRAVENRGLEDEHVKLLVIHILNSANVNVSDLTSILYPLSDN